MPILRVKPLNITSVLATSDQSMRCFNPSHFRSCNYVLRGLIYNVDLLWSCLAWTVLARTPSWKFSANPTLFTVLCFLFPKLLFIYHPCWKILAFLKDVNKKGSFLLMVGFTLWRPFSISFLSSMSYSLCPWTINQADAKWGTSSLLGFVSRYK